jgi:hypothetical protein
MSQTRARWHSLVPSGGSVGGLSGASEGVASGQSATPQSGGKSIALSQSGCM